MNMEGRNKGRGIFGGSGVATPIPLCSPSTPVHTNHPTRQANSTIEHNIAHLAVTSPRPCPSSPA